MGKRKERRLAAMTSAGRRVKLDLFAEPSGDLGGSSGQDEVGGGDDSKNRAGLPNSPSSSGQQPENPLLLLEQYSDDELDEESSKSVNSAIVENFLADFDDQAKVAAGKECEENEATGHDALAAKKVEQHSLENVSASVVALQKLEGNGIGDNDATTEAVDPQREVESTEQVSVAATSDVQVGGDVSSGWKLVLHEESSRYYYWNTMTGETSWEVPHSLILKTDDVAGENAVPGTHKSSSTLEAEPEDAIASLPGDGSKDENPNYEMKETYEHRPETEVRNEGHTSDMLDIEDRELDVDQFDGKMSRGSLSEPYNKSSSPGKQSDDAQLGNRTATVADHGEHETRSNLSSSLVKHGEYLLEKLLSIKSSEGHLQGQDQISKHMLELELRLHDIKSLLSYGSSLLPFWLHSERKLKQLEDTINDEVFRSYELAKTSNVEATQKSQENLGDDIKADTTEKKRIYSTSEDSQASNYDVKVSEVLNDSHNEAYNNAAANTKHTTSVEYPNQLSDSCAGGKGEVRVVAELPTSALQSEEDMDMDVEMEVEDENPASNTITADKLGPQHYAQPEHPFSPNPPQPDEGFGIPPPPDDDWIPPPPPDNELFPPPPPDEPPESTFPPQPSEPENVQPFSYADQYSLTYPVSNFEYYGQTSTVPGNGFYSLSDGHQLPVPLPIYYGAVPNTYPGASTAVVNPVEPVSYYGLQDGTVPPTLPMVSSAESSGHVGFGSDQIRLGESQTKVRSTSLPQSKVDISDRGETEKAYVETAFASASVEAPATISVTLGTSMSSTSAVTATETVPKVQLKARSKKRTVAVGSSLKSNKKVSSLVDKWKAAKDELHEEEEDEPENAYEMLEKKRRREVEEWRAQQIASGEAKDNANFQPLGGDWRERVKRRRAQMMKAAVEEASSEEGVGGDAKKPPPQQQPPPDLNEVSRGLPSGWQAYWDESSKQVYYGNSVTSETTWIRPTT